LLKEIQEVLKRTNPPVFLVLFNSAAITLNLVKKLLRGDAETDRETKLHKLLRHGIAQNYTILQRVV
jgi:hypothetical protein